MVLSRPYNTLTMQSLRDIKNKTTKHEHGENGKHASLRNYCSGISPL